MPKPARFDDDDSSQHAHGSRQEHAPGHLHDQSGEPEQAGAAVASEDDAPILRVFLLGRFRAVGATGEIADNAWGRQKVGLLFKCILSRPRQRLAKDQAIELFWSDSAPDAAESTIRSNLSSLRTNLRAIGVHLGDDLLLTKHGMLGIQSDPRIWIDADRFETVLRAAQQSLQPLPLLVEADALYQGDYLADDRYADWATDRREYLKRLWTDLQLALAQAREANGDAAGAVAPLERLLRADACDERATQALMKLLDRLGQRAEAARVYRRLVRSLRNELDAAPSPRTEEVHRQIVLGEPADDPELASMSPASRAPGATLASLAGDSQQPAAQAPAAGGLPSEKPFLPYTPGHPFPAPQRLVGRDGDLTTLSKTLERGRAEGQIILVGAAAGTGKSTLVGALVRHAQQTGTLCLAGGAYDGEGVVPLGPFRDALADYLLAQPGERLRAELRGAAGDLAELVPELRYHLDLPDGGLSTRQPDQGRLFAAVLALVRVLIQHQPVLLCLEDLHAADAGSLALLHYLTRHTRRLPVVLVATFRSDEVPPDGPLSRLLLTVRREGIEPLALAPLGHDESADLVATLLEGPASEQLADSLYAVTDGNPLFLEQLVLAMREDGQVAWGGSAWNQIRLAENTPPPIINDVLERRFNRLSERCRATLSMAAVLGQSVEQEHLLAALAPSDELSVLDDLDRALTARILTETPTGYAFGHAMFREVLYWGLAARRRMFLHARAGEALERLARDRSADRAAELAHHFGRSGQSPEIRAKSLRYNLEAGRRAAELSAYQSALAHFVKATELVEQVGEEADAEQRLDALEGQGHAERDLALWSACLASFRQMLQLASDPVRRGRAHGAITYTLQQIGDTDAALVAADAGLRELEGQGDAPDVLLIRLEILHRISFIRFLRGQYQEVLRLGEQILPDAERLGQWRPLFWAHSSVAWGNMGLGRIEPAVAHHQRALAAAEQEDNKVIVALSYSNLGNLFYYGGRFDEARQHLEFAIVLYHQLGSDLRAVITRQTLGRIFLAQGDPERARELANIALPLAQEGQDRWEAECHDLLGAVHSWHTEWEAAEVSFGRALAIRERVRDTAGTVESLIGLGLVAQRRGDWAHAQTEYARAAEAASALDPSPQEVAARRHLGRLLWLMGDEVGGLRQLEQAFALVDSMPHSIEYAPTMLARSEVLWRSGDLDGAIAAAETSLAAAVAIDAVIEAAVVLATYLAMARRPDDARPHVAQALLRAKAVGTPRLLGLARLGEGRVEAVENLAAAEDAFTAAIEHFDVARAPYARALTQRDYARTLLDRGAAPEHARALLDDAVLTFQELGAEPALVRAQAALGNLGMPAELLRP